MSWLPMEKSTMFSERMALRATSKLRVSPAWVITMLGAGFTMASVVKVTGSDSQMFTHWAPL